MLTEQSSPVDRCPTCEEHGRDVRATLDTRVLVGGRGMYRCPECREIWQNADEPQKFSGKDLQISRSRR